jgi:hypothetical protein
MRQTRPGKDGDASPAIAGRYAGGAFDPGGRERLDCSSRLSLREGCEMVPEARRVRFVDRSRRFQAVAAWSALAARAMLSANSGVSRRLWSDDAAWRAAAASSKVWPRSAMNSMNPSVAYAVTVLL